MTCPACKQPNSPASRFCNGCGQKLSEAEGPAPTSYTPRHLADKILTSKDALEGERKLVTVLFVDVSGFTALSERLDPEEVHQLMDRAFELMLAEIHRYEGTVNQVVADLAHHDRAGVEPHADPEVDRAVAHQLLAIAGDRPVDAERRVHGADGVVLVRDRRAEQRAIKPSPRNMNLKKAPR